MKCALYVKRSSIVYLSSANEYNFKAWEAQHTLSGTIQDYLSTTYKIEIKMPKCRYGIYISNTHNNNQQIPLWAGVVEYAHLILCVS